VNITDVARAAGVSIATVSRAFGSPEKVTDETRAHIEAVAKKLGYIPNSSARVLRTRRSNVLGVVLPTLINPVFAECLEGIARAAHTRGYSILPITTDYQIDAEARAVNLFIASNVDGVLLVVSNPAQSAALDNLKARHIPYVLAYNAHDAHPCVSVDSEAAVAEVVSWLVGKGHRRIAMVAGHLSASDRAQRRHRGYLKAMASHDIAPCDLIEVPFMDASVEIIGRHLTREQPPSALFCSNDLLAIRSIRAAHDAGLKVPEDVSIVGFDGIELGMDLTPRLTTIVQPNREMGRVCVTLLADGLAAGTPLTQAASRTLAHTLRLGESAAPFTDPN